MIKLLLNSPYGKFNQKLFEDKILINPVNINQFE